jgi:hypothetical protein
MKRPASLDVTLIILAGYAAVFALGALAWLHRG